jgi:ubiquinone/menaquinone biosynthesis C-methylase UbiE
MTRKFRHSLAMFVAPTVCLLAIAHGVAFGQADRETWQPPDRIMDAIGAKPGMQIGEAGAGKGYFTFPLARRVGPKGVVFANDISTSSLDVIRDRASEEGLGNIKIVLGEIEDPLFPEEDLDMIVMVYVLHMLEKPVEFLRNVRKYLDPGAPLVIIEKNTTKERAHYPSFMTNRQILNTMGETGFELIRTETFLPKDTIYIYETRETTESP